MGWRGDGGEWKEHGSYVLSCMMNEQIIPRLFSHKYLHVKSIQCYGEARLKLIISRGPCQPQIAFAYRIKKMLMPGMFRL